MKSRSPNSVKERAKYIPLRLSLSERKMLRLMEASMTCCDYTTEIDKPFKSSTRRTHAQLKGIAATLRGLVTACDFAAGQVSPRPNGNGITPIRIPSLLFMSGLFLCPFLSLAGCAYPRCLTETRGPLLTNPFRFVSGYRVRS